MRSVKEITTMRDAYNARLANLDKLIGEHPLAEDAQTQRLLNIRHLVQEKATILTWVLLDK